MGSETFNKIEKFREGNYVRCNKSSYDEVKNYWSELMKPMLDGKYRKILSVEEIFDTEVLLEIEGIQTYGNPKTWCYSICDLDVRTQEECENKNKNFNLTFKVGDWVSYEGYFKGVKQIEEIIGDQAIIKDISFMSFVLNNLTLVCGFSKGDKVECALNESFLSCLNCEFYAYEPTLEQPFIVIEKETGTVLNMPYCRKHIIR